MGRAIRDSFGVGPMGIQPVIDNYGLCAYMPLRWPFTARSIAAETRSTQHSLVQGRVTYL